MNRRPGLTMTELLVAIFVVAIGLAGVMSLVPFGAKQMSDALVADRAATHAATIDGFMRTYWKEKVADDTSGTGSGEAFWAALDNPAAGLPPGSAPTTPPPSLLPTDTVPSYPVFVDPIGVARPSPGNVWVGDGGTTQAPSTYIPRRTLSIYPDSPPAGQPAGPDFAIRMWSQPDGFSWDEDSSPETSQREYRYNALAVIQRPTNSDRKTATLKVIVFSNRRPRFFPTGSEAVFSVNNFTPTRTDIQLPATADVQKGGWIMDATVDNTMRHAHFYRVVSAVDNGAVVSGVPVLDIELHTPIKRLDGSTAPYAAKVVVLPGVAGVFDRPLLTGNYSP